MDPTIGTLLAALVGAAAALLGAGLAPIVQSRRAHQQWQRDKLAERAEAFLEVLLEASHSVRKDVQDDWDEKSSEDVWRYFDELSDRVRDAYGRLDLYATARLRQAGGDVVDAYRHAGEMIYGSKHLDVGTAWDPEGAREAFRVKYADARHVLRAELDLKEAKRSR